MLQDIKTRAKRRSGIIEGQVRGLQKMIAEEKYCIDILTQSLAIQKALGSLNKLILENHMETHVKHVMHKGTSAEQAKLTKELLELYELTNNKGGIR